MPDNLLTMQVALAADEICGTGQRIGVLRSRRRRGASAARRAGAAFASTLPFQATGNTRFFAVEGRQIVPGDVPDALYRVGTGDYLRTLGVVAD